MKIQRIVLFALTLCLAGCSKKVDLEPTSFIKCEKIGLGSSHEHHQAFESILQRYVDLGLPGISATIYTEDNGLWTGTAGLANIDDQIGMSTCHILHSGSVAKTYTVAAAMLMVEQGRLGLDDPISDYLPSDLTANLPNAQSATVRQLMNHQAGMPDHDNDDDLSKYLDKNQARLPSAAKQMSYLYDDSPRFEPGQAAEYSSAHTVVLSMILDKIDGRHHSHIISESIIQTLGLTRTYYKNEPGYPNPPNSVHGYAGIAQKNNDISMYAQNYSMGSQGDAGLMASTHDYYLFLRALMEGNLVSNASLDDMLDPVSVYKDTQFELAFGLGLFIMNKDDEVVKIGHGGHTLGGMTHLYYYPKAKAYISLATNTITEDDEKLLQAWTGPVFAGAGGDSIIEQFENIVLART